MLNICWILQSRFFTGSPDRNRVITKDCACTGLALLYFKPSRNACHAFFTFRNNNLSSASLAEDKTDFVIVLRMSIGLFSGENGDLGDGACVVFSCLLLR